LETGLDHLSLHSSHARSTTEFQSKQLGKGVLESTRHNEPDQRKTILYSTEIGAYALQKSEAYAATRPCAIVRRRRRDRQLNRSSIGEKLTTGRGASFATAAGSSFASAAGSSFASPSAAGSSFASPSAAGSSLATRRRRGLLLCDTAPARARAPPLRHGDGAEEWIDLSREEGGGRGWQVNLNRRLRVAHGKGMRYG
jgi:hypothetical protein